MERSRAQVIEQLRREIERSRAEFTDASTVHQSLMDEIPSGLPYPDGESRIRIASERMRDTLRAYTRAVHRYDTFVRSGILPDDAEDAAAV